MQLAQHSATANDGTVIAYERLGTGPTLIIVAAALADRSGTTKLAQLLAATFTVINYDRRGRGQSTDTPPYAPEREIEDIAALIEANGGSAYVFGSSSGAVLALDASAKLGDEVHGLFLYEPPLIVDGSHPPMPTGLADQAAELLKQGKRHEAVKLFFTKGMGIPGFGVTLMRWLMPGWSKMAAMAHTILYDLTILREVQTGKPLPAERWTSLTTPTHVLVGSRSEAFFHSGAQALASLLPTVTYRPLEGGSHASVLLQPKPLVAAIQTFFLSTTAG